MGFSLNGRHLGDTPSEALSNMTRKEVSDLAYFYIVQYFNIEDVAETLANNRESSVDWAEDALNSLVEYDGADCPGDISGLTYSRESKPKASKCVKRTGSSKTASKPKRPAKAKASGRRRS